MGAAGLSRLAASFRPGERVFLPGGCAEPTELLEAFASDPGLTRGLEITTSFLPGINRIDAAWLDPSARLTGLFMQPDLAEAQRAGRFRHLPVSYYGFVRLLQERLRFDTLVVKVAPPDRQGNCSLGVAAEFTPEIAARAGRIVALITPSMPSIPTAPSLPYDRFDLVAETDGPLRTYDTGAPDATSLAIARHIAPLVEDGTALQIGLGKVPVAMLGLLGGRKGLRLQTGLLSDSVMDLVADGLLDPDYPHTTCTMVGTPALYRWIEGRSEIRFQGCEQTHNPLVLGATPRLLAINSALEVDLFGQCNLELAGGRAVSGAGGAPDFAAAAARGAGSISLVALPATFGRAQTSRIIPRLGERTMATLPRSDVQVVVTEHGAADLRGLSVHERAAALIAIAAPAARESLECEWAAIAAAL